MQGVHPSKMTLKSLMGNLWLGTGIGLLLLKRLAGKLEKQKLGLCGVLQDQPLLVRHNLLEMLSLQMRYWCTA